MRTSIIQALQEFHSKVFAGETAQVAKAIGLGISLHFGEDYAHCESAVNHALKSGYIRHTKRQAPEAFTATQVAETLCWGN